MRETREPLDYAEAAIDTIMRKYNGKELPPKGHFHYHQGVFLSGVYENYLLNGDERYWSYIKSWVDSVLTEDGKIIKCDKISLDDIQPGILLFPIYERTKERKYKKALDELINRIEHYPKNREGGFWHKEIFANEMWLDGLYMVCPFCVKYAKEFRRMDLFDLMAFQILLMEEKTRDEKSGLWYHAYDFEKKAEWADKETGLSSEFWGRSIGWVPVAVLDVLDEMPETHQDYPRLVFLVERLLKAICRYQSENGRWYQVVNKPGEPGNWPENSCTCLYVAALCKAVRKKILGEEYLELAVKGYEAVISSLKWKEKDLLLGEVCIGTGVGDYSHYCERPVSVNDLHGVGAFLLMCAQMQKNSIKM